MLSGFRCIKKCIDSRHCDAEKFLCHPESNDRDAEYLLDESDLYQEKGVISLRERSNIK